MTTIKNKRGRPKSINIRDTELVPDGLGGYIRVARSLTRRFYQNQLPTHEDCEQAASLAALEALDKVGPNGPLNKVSSAIRFVLYRQVKAYGFKMVNTRKADGKRTANWTNQEVVFSSLPQTYRVRLGLEPQRSYVRKEG
ncbi:MAG TPA: hypothetical protein VH186_23195 [Chloroflexia bacterium]|nr:hypothetical protein [Chloroflexia bacterium]